MDISVVIPCYNRERTISRSINSAIAQTRPVKEIVVVDDGSSDRSADAAAACGAPVRVIRTENRGAAAARNRGISEAEGEWVAFLDSDDYWLPDHLERQQLALQRFPAAQLVFSDTVVTAGEAVVIPSRFALGGLRGEEVERDGEAALYDRSLFLRMLTQSRVITSAVSVRRSLPELRFPEHIWGSEDWALWLTLALRYPFASVDILTVCMTRGGDNLTGNAGKIRRNDVLTLETLLCDSALTPEERRAVEARLPPTRAAALYSSLAAGEAGEARRIWPTVRPSEVGLLRYLLYGAASLLPASLLCRVARARKTGSGQGKHP